MKTQSRIITMRATEEVLTSQQTRDLLEAALTDAQGVTTGYLYVWVRDWTAEWVVYEVDAEPVHGTFKRVYSIDESTNAVTLGEAEEVVAQTTFIPAGEVVTESVRVEGRVLGAKESATGEVGGRVFRVQIVAYGDSKNGRRYTESVMRKAAPLYEGAKAFDHHRNDAELRSSTIAGLVGMYRNVEATATGIDADLCLFPGATHVAEALDAAVASSIAGLAPLIGISHDVTGRFRQTPDRVLEAVSIDTVNSADVVADPAAGGQATRVVAGGIATPPAIPAPSPTPTEKAMTLEELLALIDGATAEQRAKALAGLGLTEDAIAKLTAGDVVVPVVPVVTEVEPEPELVGATEAKLTKTGLIAGTLVDAAIAQKNLNPELRSLVIEGLPDRFTEAELVHQVDAVARVAESFGRRSLAPSVPDVRVTGEDRDARLDKLDAFFDPQRTTEGYKNLKSAFRDIMGIEAGLDEIDAQDIIRESWTGRYDSGRILESMTTASWGEVLGDSITRRMVAAYGMPNLQTWRNIVSSIYAPTDFRTQRLDRIGGYGVLPTVTQGNPYTALTSPTDEEATYAVSKKGGTEDITWEMVKNDDLRAIRDLPVKLGRAAAQTLYRGIWGILPANAAVTYDSVALFHATHANTDATAILAQATLSAARAKMRKQTAYGDASEVMGDVLIPKYLVVPTDLEEIAFQLCTSAVAIPATPAGPSDTPNINQGLTPVVVDFLSDANDWFLIADPSMCPTIEVGFLDGKQDPELFVNDDPTQGAVFSNDKITYKIRHVWGATVIDHRGFYRGANA